MNINIIAVGRLKEPFWTQAANEYLKRISKYATISVTEVADRDPARSTVERAMQEEGADILRAIAPDTFVILADLSGKQISSEEFASRVDILGVEGRSNLAFVIGGSTGVADDVRKRADLTIAFGRMTLPHNLARIVVLEQIYRAFKIIRGEPYHK